METKKGGEAGQGTKQRRGIPCWSKKLRLVLHASWGSRSRVLPFFSLKRVCCMLINRPCSRSIVAQQATCVRDLDGARPHVAAACAFTRRAPAADGASFALPPRAMLLRRRRGTTRRRGLSAGTPPGKTFVKKGEWRGWRGNRAKVAN